MRKINVNKIKKAVSELCIEANVNLRRDIKHAMKKALRGETNKRAKRVLEILLRNAEIARKEKRALCQDTGLVSVYIQMGQGVRLTGGSLKAAIDGGVKEGYRKAFLRKPLKKFLGMCFAI